MLSRSPSGASAAAAAAGLLADRLGFAGQRRFVDLEPGGQPEAPVGRHAVACLQQQDVAGHHVVGSDLVADAVAPHAGLAGQHRLQRGQAALGAVLLVEADERIDHDHGQDHQRVLGAADQRGQDRRAEQDQDQDALELREQHTPGRACRCLRQAVGAHTRQAFKRLLGAEPGFGADLQQRRHRLGVQCVRCHGPWLGHGRTSPAAAGAMGADCFIGQGVIATFSTPSR